MSRPTKLDAQTKALLIKAIEGGMNYEDSCRFARGTYRTFRNWMVKGKAAKSGVFFQFFQDIEHAKAKGLAFHLRMINEAARSGDWQASKFILQARHGYTINKEPAPSVQIQINAEQLNMQTLLAEVKENALLIEQMDKPLIDLDEE